MFLLKRTKIYRNNQITIPNAFIQSENLSAGDTIEIYTDSINGKKAIVVIPASSNDNIIQAKYKNLVKVNQKQTENQNNL